MKVPKLLKKFGVIAPLVLASYVGTAQTAPEEKDNYTAKEHKTLMQEREKEILDSIQERKKVPQYSEDITGIVNDLGYEKYTPYDGKNIASDFKRFGIVNPQKSDSTVMHKKVLDNVLNTLQGNYGNLDFEPRMELRSVLGYGLKLNRSDDTAIFDVHFSGTVRYVGKVNDIADNFRDNHSALNGLHRQDDGIDTVKEEPKKEEKETKKKTKKSDGYLALGYAYNLPIGGQSDAAVDIPERKNNGTILASFGLSGIKGMAIEVGYILDKKYSLSTVSEEVLSSTVTNSGREYIEKNIVEKDREAQLYGHLGLSQKIANGNIPIRIGAYVVVGQNTVHTNDFNREEVWFNGELEGEGNSINQQNYVGSDSNGFIQGFGGFLRVTPIKNLEVQVGAMSLKEYAPNISNPSDFENVGMVQFGLLYNFAGNSKK